MKILSRLTLTFVAVSLLAGCAQPKAAHPSSAAKNPQERTSQVSSTHQKASTKITITINGTRLKAHLNNSSAARAFAQELPTTLRFSDYADMPEKVANLHHSLPTKGMPSGHAGTQGAIGYWSPQRRIVFYWGTESYYEGIHIIGKFDATNYRHVVKTMGNHVNVRITKE
ncbi:cyclophilin-like fold protein [Levilactobacillus suantsaii]|uniref:Cyclophilin-like domain-containing protein n=1 Tax=Levilactobacillus suantsaii TaxID=2292255 RepID=A0A4Q0VJK3_9LACO|nr:cyclophilin-like fold protein [Levilactobacillus suantsaii]QMU08800.1 hypothetical protein H3M12_03840 [Levilactobacillus suantsaii]RXI78969.1 hypothetical protein DXH47_05525 [Levilactobacillus suantsaii]